MSKDLTCDFTETELDIAKHTDLLSLLPSLGCMSKRVGSHYKMDSIRIKERLIWKRYSTWPGGEAISFLHGFCGMRFPEAVDYLLAYHGRSRDSPDRSKLIPRPKPPPPREKPPFVLLSANSDQRRVFAYLRKRGIASLVIQHFVEARLLYEDAQYYNSVFAGRDGSGQPKFACKRGTCDLGGSSFKWAFSSPATRRSRRWRYLRSHRPHELLHPDFGNKAAMLDGKIPFHYDKTLGYRKGPDGKPEIDPEEAETVRLIYSRCLEGNSLGNIQKELIEKKILTARGIQDWPRKVIQNILL